MKIAFFCIPAHGHTNPTLGVVTELVRRGHEVWYYSYTSMQEKILETGANFIPLDAYDPQIAFRPEDKKRVGTDIGFSTELIVNLTLALDAVLLDEMRTLAPDIIVGDSMAFWAKLIARKLRIPFISSTTTFAFNRESAKVIQQNGGQFRSFLRGLPQANRSLRRLKKQGYPVNSVLDIIANDNDTHTIVYTSKDFQPCAETFSERYAFVGPIPRPAKTAYARDEKKTVFISLGTVDNENRPFYEACIKAFRDGDYRVILSVGTDTDIASFEPLPNNIELYPSVDQVALLTICDVFLTHCGMNSVSEALYQGVPLVLYPITPEQRGVANRAHALGAGRFLSNTTPTAIREAVDTVLTDDSYRASAERLQTGLRQCGGAGLAADTIERVAALPYEEPKPILSRGQRAQIIVGSCAILCLIALLFVPSSLRVPLLIAGSVLGMGSNALRLLDRPKKGKQ